MDLYSDGDFVSQGTRDWCVPAATLILANISGDGPADTSKAAQAALYARGRALSPETADDKGISPVAWEQLLDATVGPYQLIAAGSRRAALRAAARAIRATGRPVALVTWRGAHSWVMSGFEATADPAWTDRFEVIGVWIEDPWYPRVSSIWGRSSGPDRLVSFEKLGEDYLPFRRPRNEFPEFNGRYLLLVPEPAGIGGRARRLSAGT